MKSLNLFTAIATLFILSNSSVRAQENKSFLLSNFSEIAVSSGIDVYLTQSNSENIRVNAPKEVLNNVLIEKQGNTLVIKYKDKMNLSRFLKGQGTKVYVNYKTLQGISASGGSDVYTENTLKTDKLSLNASGGADLKINVITKDIEIHTSGGSDVDLKGSATNMGAEASGGSDINALEFIVENARVNTSGGSDINIHVTKALEANASGGSDVNYKGNPAVKKSSGKSGDISRIN
ncbi:MAG: head GIN domain-containing protein [Bacteroidota bacterium]